MVATTFQERLARIEARQNLTPVQPCAGPVTSGRPAGRASAPAPVRGNLAWFALGAVLGVLMGVLMQGAVMPGSPWGPGTEYGVILGMAGMGGLLAAPPLMLVSVYLRRARPGFFFFSVAYGAAVIISALL